MRLDVIVPVFTKELDEKVAKIAHSSLNAELTILTQDSAFDLACMEGLECLKIDGLKPQKIVTSPPLESSMSPLRNKLKSQMSGCEQFSEDSREGHPYFAFSPERALRDNVSP